MADAHLRRFDVVAVWDFSRFARSTSHLLRALETFSALGVDFLSLREQIETVTPAGKMVFAVLASVSELEKSIIGERVRAGLRNAVAKGKKLGRPSLRELTDDEISQIRRERRTSKISFKELATKHRISTWTAFHLCKRRKA